MKRSEYPTSPDADICLILEGTYPFLSGGVANWIYELIKAFPEYRFAAIFLGTKEEEYGDFRYKLADNLVHLDAHYLFEDEPLYELYDSDIDKETIDKVNIMHDKFALYLSGEVDDVNELFEVMSDSARLTKKDFLRSKSSWELIVKKYIENHEGQSFFDYFWTIRNLHRPFWDLADIVDKIPRVKVLHTASTGYAGFLGALLQKRYQLPYIVTEHGLYTKERWIELMRGFFFENVSGKDKEFETDKSLVAIWIQFFTILAKLAYRSADIVISLFEEYRQRQVDDGARQEAQKIISYGIDFKKYYFLDKKPPGSRNPIIACVGRVVPIKDVKTFIRASALIIKKIPNAEAWIVGSTVEDSSYVDTCINLIEILGMENKIKLLPSQDIMKIYEKIDLLMSCSISEGSPFVILESFAVGVPVIATNVGGCRELIYGKNKEDEALGIAGRLVNIADPDALASASFELLTNEDAWLASQKSGLARIRKYYSIEKFRDSYKLIYEEAMSHGRNRI